MPDPSVDLIGRQRGHHMGTIQNPSLPKDKIKILLLENISDTAVNALKGAGYRNIERLTKALEGKALIDALQGVRLLGIRSRSEITVGSAGQGMPKAGSSQAKPRARPGA